jgi:hypothetical protein
MNWSAFFRKMLNENLSLHHRKKSFTSETMMMQTDRQTDRPTNKQKANKQTNKRTK